MTMERGLLLAMEQGAVSVPYLLLQWYARLGLTEADVMLLIHLTAFKEKEQKDFPTIEEIQSRMDLAPEQVIASIQKLMGEGWISIDETIDPETDIQYERYNISGVYQRLANVYADWSRSQGGLSEERRHTAIESTVAREDVPSEIKLFDVFEKEFGRPLSPMECETIAGWLDQDGYSQDLIIAALKESVFAGKVHFRYIDRILLEWARNRVKTPEEAKAYTIRYRGGES